MRDLRIQGRKSAARVWDPKWGSPHRVPIAQANSLRYALGLLRGDRSSFRVWFSGYARRALEDVISAYSDKIARYRKHSFGLRSSECVAESIDFTVWISGFRYRRGHSRTLYAGELVLLLEGIMD